MTTPNDPTNAHSAERELIEASGDNPGAFLVNWPPSRGPLPPERRFRTTYRWRKPTIELVSASVRPMKFPSNALSVFLPIVNVAHIRVQDARVCIHGTSIGESKHSGKSYVNLTSHLPVKTYIADLRYPLSHVARVTIAPYTIRNVRESDGRVSENQHCDVGYLLVMLARAYRRIYRDHERWGVWGHGIDDLVFESFAVRGDTIHVGIGS